MMLICAILFQFKTNVRHINLKNNFYLALEIIPYPPSPPALVGKPEKSQLHLHAGKTRINRHIGKYEISLLEDGRLIYFGLSKDIFYFKEKKINTYFSLCLSLYFFYVLNYI